MRFELLWSQHWGWSSQLSQWHWPVLGAILAQDLISDFIWDLSHPPLAPWWFFIAIMRVGGFKGCSLFWSAEWCDVILELITPFAIILIFIQFIWGVEPHWVRQRSFCGEVLFIRAEGVDLLLVCMCDVLFIFIWGRSPQHRSDGLIHPSSSSITHVSRGWKVCIAAECSACVHVHVKELWLGHLSTVGWWGISGSMLQFVALVAFDLILFLFTRSGSVKRFLCIHLLWSQSVGLINPVWVSGTDQILVPFWLKIWSAISFGNCPAHL